MSIDTGKQFEVTISLPEFFHVPVGTGENATPYKTRVEPARYTPELIAMAVRAGFEGALGNISRASVGSNIGDEAWADARAKKAEVWLEGDWGSTTREQSDWAKAKEQYVFEREHGAGIGKAKIEAAIKQKFETVFGKATKDNRATFEKFVEAVAMDKAVAEGVKKDANGWADKVAEIKDGLKAGLIERGNIRKAEMAKLAGELKTEGVDLGL